MTLGNNIEFTMKCALVALTTASFFGTLAIAAPPQKKAAAPSATAGNAAKGKETFEQCAVCHSPDTDEQKMGPSLKGIFKHPSLKNGEKVSEESIRKQINNGGNGMPAYSDMLSNEEKNNLIAYLKSL